MGKNKEFEDTSIDDEEDGEGEEFEDEEEGEGEEFEDEEEDEEDAPKKRRRRGPRKRRLLTRDGLVEKLSDAVAAKGIPASINHIRTVTDALLDLIREMLLSDEMSEDNVVLDLPGIGQFSTKEQDERIVRVPATKDWTTMGRGRSINFKVSKAIKDEFRSRRRPVGKDLQRSCIQKRMNDGIISKKEAEALLAAMNPKRRVGKTTRRRRRRM